MASRSEQTARRLKTEPAVLAGMLLRITEDPRYARDRGILIEAVSLIEGQLINPQPMTMREVADYIRQPIRYVSQLVQDEKIPFHQAGKNAKIMFDRAEIRAWWPSIRHDPRRNGRANR